MRVTHSDINHYLFFRQSRGVSLTKEKKRTRSRLRCVYEEIYQTATPNRIAAISSHCLITHLVSLEKREKQRL